MPLQPWFMDAHNHTVSADAAWALFWRLANEQQDLALLICSKLPAAQLRTLHMSCRRLRRLIEAGVSRASFCVADIVGGPPRCSIFPNLRAIELYVYCVDRPHTNDDLGAVLCQQLALAAVLRCSWRCSWS